jgi:hypothetical protein
VDGAALMAAIEAGACVGFIGSINGLFASDIGFFRTDVLLPQFGSYPPLLATNGTEYQFQLGIWLNNYGQNAQSGVTATATISQDGNTVYTITSDPIDMAPGDSVFIDLDFIQPTIRATTRWNTPRPVSRAMSSMRTMTTPRPSR